ncbi:Uncharacterised protein [Serratia grimesii]|uniref:hypothetical protein n=1 Tax=Serratia grimesii TaxID=82995 RepID=UPI00217A3C69|nr:hypothetical protein [Serratia grimesii]CAI1834159.1 Uncharacterised protein [Serratia grimesii]
MTKQELYTAIVVDVLVAIDCASRGETHWRINGMMARTAAHLASFNPPCPIHLLPAERRTFSKDNPQSPKPTSSDNKLKNVVRLVGICWEFPDGTRLSNFLAASQKAKSLDMVLGNRRDWRYSINE